MGTAVNEDNDPLRPRPPQDSRGFYVLPQAPMDSGHYVYGKLYGQLAKWAYQYAHPIMMTAIPRVALKWHATDSRRIGIGDISMAGGPKSPDHNTHRSGLEVDTDAHDVCVATSSIMIGHDGEVGPYNSGPVGLAMIVQVRE